MQPARHLRRHRSIELIVIQRREKGDDVVAAAADTAQLTEEGIDISDAIPPAAATAGAVVEPEKTGVAIPSLVGPAERPGEFPQIFKQTFNILRGTQEVMAARGPEKGLNLTVTPLNSFESQIELGADLPASGILPVKVVIANNTSRPYGMDTSKVFLQPAAGGRVTPVAPPAAGQSKALQGALTLQPGQTVSGYLFYPAGQYTSARTTLVDKETEEGEGFSVQF